jgi:hypothetical protein
MRQSQEELGHVNASTVMQTSFAVHLVESGFTLRTKQNDEADDEKSACVKIRHGISGQKE